MISLQVYNTIKSNYDACSIPLPPPNPPKKRKEKISKTIVDKVTRTLFRRLLMLS